MFHKTPGFLTKRYCLLSVVESKTDTVRTMEKCGSTMKEQLSRDRKFYTNITVVPYNIMYHVTIWINDPRLTR